MLKLIYRLGLFLIIIVVLGVSYFSFFVKPSNSKDWVGGMDKLPKVLFIKDRVVIENFRKWRYENKKTINTNYTNEDFEPDKILKVYFLMEPFDKFEGIAHTYFSFEFENGKTADISVEARREKGEDFSAFWGLFKKYELIYIWGDDEDITGRRLKIEKNAVYKYPLVLDKTHSKNLFIQLAKDTKDLETNPKFYNTFFDNCTNVLAKSANKAYPNSVPLDISWFLPGYSPKFLYRLGLIDTNQATFNKSDFLIQNDQ